MLPFKAPMDPENQNFEKMEKMPEDIIILWTVYPLITRNQNFEKMKKMPRNLFILHIFTINGNHMYVS